jgi:hypothetical protein
MGVELNNSELQFPTFNEIGLIPTASAESTIQQAVSATGEAPLFYTQEAIYSEISLPASNVANVSPPIVWTALYENSNYNTYGFKFKGSIQRRGYSTYHTLIEWHVGYYGATGTFNNDGVDILDETPAYIITNPGSTNNYVDFNTTNTKFLFYLDIRQITTVTSYWQIVGTLDIMASPRLYL